MNLLDPLNFPVPGEAGKFAQRHRCGLCLSPLSGDGIYVTCPTHGKMYEHTVIGIHTADTIKTDRHFAGAELRPKITLTPEQIIKELYNE